MPEKYDHSIKYNARMKEILPKIKSKKVHNLVRGILTEAIGDFTDYEETIQKYRKASVTDGLTGLYNKRYFRKHLDIEMKRSDRYNHPLSLVLFDIDFFKNYNHDYGHPEGDILLEQLGDMLKDISREMDIPARNGGEEFAVILPETDDPLSISKRLQEGMKNLEICKRTRPVTVSVGCGTYQPNTKNDSYEWTDFEKDVDKALYEAKEKRNTIVILSNDNMIIG